MEKKLFLQLLLIGPYVIVGDQNDMVMYKAHEQKLCAFETINKICEDEL